MKSLFILIILYVYVCVCLSNVHGLQCTGSHEEIKCVKNCPPDKTCLNKDLSFNCYISDEACQLKCMCEDNYYRNTEGECVTNENCVPSCGLNEEYKTCTCPPDTCMSLVAKFKCGPCVPGCACRAGYLRQTAQDACRPMRECSELANSPDFN